MKKITAIILTIALLFLLTACGDGDDTATFPREVMVDENTQQDAEPDDIGISLEYIGHTSRVLSFSITNNSDFDIRYGNGYELTGNQWGYAGEADYEFFDLPSGGHGIAYAQVYQIGFGEFRMSKNIVIEPDNPINAREYTLVAEFALDNTTLSPDVHDVKLEVDADFSTNIGIMIDITNGFEVGRIYFDQSFWLQRNSGGTWRNVPAIGSDSFLYDTHSLAPRQILKSRIYWEWLYGELPPGEYRIGKSFLHRTDGGEDTQHDLYATFTLDGKPVPDTVIKDDGSSWSHPLGNVAKLRAEVTELLDPGYHHISPDTIGLLVSGLTPVWNETETGDKFYVFDNYNFPVLDSDGRHIRFSDIKSGAIVDITHSGLFLTSDPAIITDVYLIEIVE